MVDRKLGTRGSVIIDLGGGNWDDFDFEDYDGGDEFSAFYGESSALIVPNAKINYIQLKYDEEKTDGE